VAWLRAALAALVAAAVGTAALSGGSPSGPRAPAALPGLPAPFLGTAVVGDGGLTAAIDAYGSVVDLRAPGPAGQALIENSAERQAAGTVAADTGIVPWLRVGGGATRPFWRADSVRQRYLPGTNVVRTVARFGAASVMVVDAVADSGLARVVSTKPAGMAVATGFEVNAEADLECQELQRPRHMVLVCAVGERSAPREAERTVAAAIGSDRRWVATARPLGQSAPAWAEQMYRRSLLVLRALTDRRSGAVAAGARDGWAYVWPRDAGAVALAFAAAGYRPEARRVARFLVGLDLEAAARFHGDGTPVPGRAAQGDAAGWAAVANRAAGWTAHAALAGGVDGPKPGPYRRKSAHRQRVLEWPGRADYWEGEPGAYLGNALAAGIDVEAFETRAGLVRRMGDPRSGLDSAAAWAVQPFSQPALYPVAQRTLMRLTSTGTRYGITPGEDWSGVDPWSAPTAWSAWSLAALSQDARRSGSMAAGRRDRRAALRLLAALRRAATPAGALPERVDVRTGVPRSTTPLAWSHAFAILALRQLWPSR
jgi:glucoamylase